MPSRYDLRDLDDSELLSGFAQVVGQDCQTKADLIAKIAEVDRRKLYLGKAHSSLFRYCVDRFNMPEGTTGRRIHAARTARRYPVIFEMVAQGDLHLTGVGMLATHLTEENHLELLAATRRMSTRRIEHLLAEWFPKPDVMDTIRKMPQPRAGGPAPNGGEQPPAGSVDTPAREAAEGVAPEPGARPVLQMTPPAMKRGKLTPLAPGRFKVELTADQELHDMLLQAQAFMRHKNPKGDLATIIKEAMRLLLDDVKRKKFGATKRSKTSAKSGQRATEQAERKSSTEGKNSRYIPAEVRRAVAERDGYRCAFVSEDGQRCTETGFIEFQHTEPHGKGGPPTVENITLYCQAHNAYAAAQDYGAEFIERRKREAKERAARKTDEHSALDTDERSAPKGNGGGG